MYNHFLITRFNVGYLDNVTNQNPNEWLEERMFFFEKYCYQSINNQIEKSFRWLVFFDKRTPLNYLEKIKNIDTGKIITICFSNSWDNSDLVVKKEITSLIDINENKVLITSRIDNDDMISKDFIREVKSKAEIILKNKGVKSFAINFPNGYIYDLRNRKLIEKRQFSNPFISLIETGDTFKTVFFDFHDKISQKIITYNYNDPAFFFQIVHGSNLKNKPIGNPQFFLDRRLEKFLSEFKINKPSILARLYWKLAWFFGEILKKGRRWR